MSGEKIFADHISAKWLISKILQLNNKSFNIDLGFFVITILNEVLIYYTALKRNILCGLTFQTSWVEFILSTLSGHVPQRPVLLLTS